MMILYLKTLNTNKELKMPEQHEWTLHWDHGVYVIVTGANLANACKKADITRAQLDHLKEVFMPNGDRVRVKGRAQCGCVHHAEEDIACDHDLKEVGLGEFCVVPLP